MADRALATIQTIEKVWTHSNADRLDIARVLGWNVIVLRNEYKAGDKTIYVQIDSICPPEEWADFLAPRKYRIKTQKLRGELSQGICFPLSVLEAKLPEKKFSKLGIGDDVTDILGISQWLPPHLRPRKRYYATSNKKLTLWQKIKNFFFMRRDAKRRRKMAFPTHLVPKTKETRIQNSPSILRNHEGDVVDVTEKVDGMSMTAVRVNGSWTLYSRNWKIGNMQGDQATLYITAFENEKIEDKLLKYKGDIAIQGEVVGPGVSGSGKGNLYKFDRLRWFVFNIYDITEQSYFNYFEFQMMVKKYKIVNVPKLSSMNLPGTIEEMIEETKGKSVLNLLIHREGLVVRSRDMNNGRWQFSFKCINPDYLLKHEL